MKIEISEKNALYPMPVVLVGADVGVKANFITIAHVGIVTMDMISLGMNKVHYTNRGIIEHREFSINIPSVDMVIETDYAGIYSGSKTDKSNLFKTWRGTLAHAPMIENAPVAMECTLVDHYDYKTHDLFIGKIVKIYADDAVVANGTIDGAKVRPMLFDMHQRKYWKLGAPFADAWSIGKEYKAV